MKISGITVGNSRERDNCSLEKFLVSEQARSPLGKLLVALSGEQTWSNDFDVFADFAVPNQYLNINHPAFLSDRCVMLYERDGVLTVFDVEKAIQKYIENSRDCLRASIELLKSQSNHLQSLINEIDCNKARAVVVASFPEATKTQLLDPSDRLMCFYKGRGENRPIYIVRRQRDRFEGGVVKLEMSPLGWYGLKPGNKLGQREAVFWVALARAFVSNAMNIDPKELHAIDISCTEQAFDSRSWHVNGDRYLVESVTFNHYYTGQDREKIVVVFDENNHPCSASVLQETEANK